MEKAVLKSVKEMGNKEAKFKKMYKEIDISGNGEVNFKELAAFIMSDKVSGRTERVQ